MILITIDTLRADHCGIYGYERDTTPFLDSLAEKGVVFTRAFSPMSMTSPSHASIFTSLYPLEHRVLRNGHRLSEKYTTLAELLLEEGYETAAVVSIDRFFEKGDLDQGFAHWDEPLPSDEKYRRAD